MQDETTQPFEQITAKFYPRWQLQRTEQLTGGISAQLTTLLLTQSDGKAHKVIVRQHGKADHTRNPNIAADEFKLLHQLQAAGIPVPTPYHLDTSCEILPTPYLIIEYINGETVFTPPDVTDYLRQFAAILARIHQVDVPTLLHGDYWFGNVLWRDGELIAVVDWEDAAIGDPLSDVANARLEVLWALGKDAMHTFTQQYQAHMPQLDYTTLPQWDVWAAQKAAGKFTDWAPDEQTAKTMLERHQWFANQAQQK